MPIVKITAIKDSMLGKSRAKEVSGTKPDGQEWKKSFFSNQKDLVDQLANYGVGDTVFVEMEKKGEYWNVTGFRDLTSAEKAGGRAPAKSSPQTSTYKRPDGGSRGDDTNRSASIYLAREIIMGAQDCPPTASEITQACLKLAETFIFPYIKDGDHAPFEPPKRGKRETAIPDPPDIE